MRPQIKGNDLARYLNEDFLRALAICCVSTSLTLLCPRESDI